MFALAMTGEKLRKNTSTSCISKPVKFVFEWKSINGILCGYTFNLVETISHHP